MEANIASCKNISFMANENSWKGPSSKLYLFKYVLKGTLYRKVNAHSIHKLGSCPSGIKFIEMWFVKFFFFFLTSTYLMDVTHTSVTMNHYSIIQKVGRSLYTEHTRIKGRLESEKPDYVIITFVGNKKVLFLPPQRSHLG